jgi:hypothetical protein
MQYGPQEAASLQLWLLTADREIELNDASIKSSRPLVAEPKLLEPKSVCLISL